MNVCVSRVKTHDTLAYDVGMSNTIAQPRQMLIAEYLEREFHAPTKSEFVDGELIDMAGVREPHVLVVSNLVALIHAKLKGKPCRVYSTDLRVRIKHRPRYRYPDVFIICGKTEFDENDARQMSVTNPRVIIEVLSDSTENEDRSRKFNDYRSLESFEEYVLIDQSEASVEWFRRQADGDWSIGTAEGLDAILTLGSMGIELPLKEIYANVELPIKPTPEAEAK
jgi:Uma2 family endonuclease